MRNDHYVVESLELHLFFGRIMKEHALFIRELLDPCKPNLLILRMNLPWSLQSCCTSATVLRTKL